MHTHVPTIHDGGPRCSSRCWTGPDGRGMKRRLFNPADTNLRHEGLHRHSVSDDFARSQRPLAIVFLGLFSIAAGGCAERTFPRDAVKDADAIRVTRAQPGGGRIVSRMADPSILQQARRLAERYDTWPAISECRTGDCGDILIEWMTGDSTAVTMSVCNVGTRARVGEAGMDSPCGRRITDQETRAFLAGL